MSTKQKKRNPWRPSGRVLLLAALAILAGCAGAYRNYGSLHHSQEVTDRFHAYEVLPDHQYYYTGPDAWPFGIIAIHRDYSLVSDFWKPVDPSPSQLRNWLNFPRVRVGYDPRLYGSEILGPAGERIGIWYAVRDWRSRGTVILYEDNRVSITTPDQSTLRPHVSLGFVYPFILLGDWRGSRCCDRSFRHHRSRHPHGVRKKPFYRETRRGDRGPGGRERAEPRERPFLILP